MLRPQDNVAREARPLDGLWRFRIDTDGVGRQERWWAGSLADARPMPVPASYNDVLVDREIHDHVGDAWYQRDVFVPPGWDGRRVILRLDAACHHAVVWFDDEQVAEHQGGYTPFEADVTHLARPGQEHRVTVVVNNELTWQTLPPGIVSLRRDGRKQVHYYHDFYNYSGLHRSVWLCTTPRTHLDDITIVTERDGTTGLVRCTVAVAGTTEASIRVELRDEAGELVAEGTGESTELRVPDAKLWAPGAPYLYDLTVDLVDGDAIVDRYCLPVGIRTVRVDGTKFLINDEPFYFKGFGMHEDHTVRGKGHDPASMVHDFALLDWLGANSFRTSHYPYAEEVLDHADRLGIVVIDETAAVGLNLGVGGGMFLGGDRVTFSDDTVNDATQDVHRQAIRELVARDKNHPSVVLWCLANEPETHTPESKDYFAPLFDLARELDPTRPVGIVNMLLSPPDRCLVTALADVVMINRYYGWYLGFDLAEAAEGLEGELQAWADKHGMPIIITEYGGDAVAGIRSVGANPWSEEYQADLLDTYHEVFDRIDEVVGEHVWNFADFATATSFMRVDGNKKGVFTRDRQPKLAAHHLRARWRGEA
ncbi:MAG: beta-glucuronidase [Acidimicrobiales bacterium]